MLSFVGPNIISTESYIKRFNDVSRLFCAGHCLRITETGNWFHRHSESHQFFNVSFASRVLQQMAFVTYGKVVLILTSPATALDFTKL
jgi:hypothetical protein